MDRIYLDNAASTPLSDAVREAMRPWLDDCYANPSSAHRLGVEAASAVDHARAQLAKVVGARASNVIFTAGGTEADNLAICGLARARRKHGKHLLLGPTEHAAVRAAAEALAPEGYEVDYARLDSRGALDLEDVERKLRPDTVVVAQILVSNEFGSVYPVAEVKRRMQARSPHAALHVDAVQGLGKLDLYLSDLGADSLALSAHKVHGPKGTGALVLAPGVEVVPLIHGGGQEGGRRGGTQNVAGIAGFGRAAELAEGERRRNVAHFERLRALFEAAVAELPGARLLEPGAPTLQVVPSIVSLYLPGVPAEVRLHHLDDQGVLASAGSACNAKKKDVSPVLLAAGLSEDEARCVLRFSFSSMTSAAEVERALAVLARVNAELEASGS